MQDIIEKKQIGKRANQQVEQISIRGYHDGPKRAEF
jgi:hypothetical protein